MSTDMLALLLRENGLADTSGFVGNQLSQPDKFLKLDRVPRPKPGPGQILIKVRRSAINPSDIAFVQGFYGQERVQGQPAGFEGVGHVVEAGPGLLGRFLKGRDVGFYVTPDGSGAWGEYAVTQAALALPLKKGVKDHDAAGLIVNPVTAAAMIDLIKPGDAFVFSAAASQLGKLVASITRDQNKKMIGLVRRADPIDALKSLGAKHVLNESDPDFAEQLAAIFSQEKPRVFLDAVAGRASALVHDAMGNRARWVVYGKLDGTPMEVLNPGALIFQKKSIEGFWTTNWAAKTPFLRKMKIFGQVQNRFRDGRWKTDISVELPLDQAVERMSQALAQPDGKVQIIMPNS